MTLMRENAFSPVGKTAIVACAAVAAMSAGYNIWRGDVPRPGLFGIAVAGCLLFLIAKVSIIAQRRWISFGTGGMSPAMANTYRAGYWLMGAGTLAAFA